MVEGCLVSGQRHRDNDGHSREQVTSEMRKLKAKHRTARSTVEDLEYLTNMCTDDGDEDDDESEHVADSADDGEDHTLERTILQRM